MLAAKCVSWRSRFGAGLEIVLGGFSAQSADRRAPRPRVARITLAAFAIGTLVLTAAPSAWAQVCGNGTVELPEACDDGNLVNGDCCSDTCAIEASGTVCRVSAGGCDPAETCDGVSSVCPGDSIFPAGAVCRAPAGICDVAETCDGVTTACPADVLVAIGTTCRASAGTCDVAETCDGAAPMCPADAVLPAATTCRGAAGSCDVAEVCDGVATACPADVVLAAATVCRAGAGSCDIAEACDGTSAACPADALVPAATVCRAAAHSCDVVEACDGATAACPADGLATDGTFCNDGDICSLASTCLGGACTGSGPTAAGQVCRPLSGPCDIAETCSGTSASCPADGFRPASAVCRGAAGVCDAVEVCSGTGVSCPADGKLTTSCRSPGGSCDVAEFCDGLSNHCPVNQYAANGTFCPDEGNPCTSDSCLNGTCAHLPGNAGALCRTALSICDVPETCTGASETCPTDITAPDGLSCDDGVSCTGGDQCVAGECRGASLTCGNGTIECGEECDDGNTSNNDDCSSTCHFTEICADLIDNEPDGRIDCLDAECATSCDPLVNGGLPPRPSRIIKKRSFDLVRLFGAIAPDAPFNPGGQRFGISISNANGVLFAASVPPGALGPRGDKHWVMRNPFARLSGGLFVVNLVSDTTDSSPVLRFSVLAFGDFTAATLANMTVQVVLGDHASFHTTSWESLRSGWRVDLP